MGQEPQIVRPAGRGNFDVAIICALQSEFDAVEALFNHHWEEEGPSYGRASGDINEYSIGCLGHHNVVLVHMPGTGNVDAAVVATRCAGSFPNIKLALVVGTCGVAPYARDGTEIILGDVIISEGVIQYDLAQRLPGQFKRHDELLHSLRRPNTEIRSLMAKLKCEQDRESLRSKMASNLAKLKEQADLGAEYPGVQRDLLFESAYHHTVEGKTCEECKCSGELVQRRRLGQATLKEGIPQPAVHFGLFASGDTVMRYGEQRDALTRQGNIVGFETEAAGVWDQFPCIVIKGACDYADSHEAHDWQTYAAATAAACAKAFLDLWAASGTVYM